MAEREIGERSLQLLRVSHELASNDPAGAVYVHQAAQKMGLGTIQYEKDRGEFMELAGELEEAGYIKRQGSGNVFFYEEDVGQQEKARQRSDEDYGLFSLTDKGRGKIEEDQQ
ncbi:MAG: hypothetical protein JOZ19_07455 [Rubrobacter sp.]|nr:hypothetical protein [Rubrobacter sp.]